jgi:hypothetical protein
MRRRGLISGIAINMMSDMKGANVVVIKGVGEEMAGTEETDGIAGTEETDGIAGTGEIDGTAGIVEIGGIAGTEGIEETDGIAGTEGIEEVEGGPLAMKVVLSVAGIETETGTETGHAVERARTMIMAIVPGEEDANIPQRGLVWQK